jgi:hypothetical protein
MTDPKVVSVIDGVTRLSDGSGFFTQSIGERPPGFLMWLKARPNGSCRRWLYLWRNFRTARTDWGSEPHLRKLPMLKAIRWAWRVS